MSKLAAYWTESRIQRLEDALASLKDDAYARAFLSRLSGCPTTEAKRDLIVKELLPAIQATENGQSTMLWEGKAIPTHLAFRDLILAYLRREGIIEQIPTGVPDSATEQAEQERLARLFGAGTPASELIEEDRGPR